jgi:hypothetical protein
MAITFQHLSIDAIENSNEIQNFLGQLPTDKKIDTISILHHLRFVSRDDYTTWLKSKVDWLPKDKKYGVYAVRKFEKNPTCLWDDSGNVIDRPGTALGSEDFVYSIIANIARPDEGSFIEHPSLDALKSNEVHDIVLLDDSIGSGERVEDFVSAMLRHKTFKSWWSYGFVRFHVISLARTLESEKRIIESLVGSDHGKRKYRKSSKIQFISEIVYSKYWLDRRWGTNYRNILALCDSIPEMTSFVRRGYGEVMGNIVFYHSVPDNLPGLLWCETGKWKPLFPERTVPDWLLQILNSSVTPKISGVTLSKVIPSEMIDLLRLVKSGIRQETTIALRLGIDILIVKALLSNAKQSGFLNANKRITEAGVDILIKKFNPPTFYNRSLYIPKSWCAGRVTVQPPASVEATPREQADPTEDIFSVGGEAGQASLERSDEKAAQPPLNVRSQRPSGSRKGPDIHGPLDSKEK